jgi:tRNA (guanine-N7-)-methyltransferase
MRLKNVKGKEKIINESVYIIKDYETYRGKFKTLFDNNNPIHLEIGMGKGDFIINSAIQNSDINYIGIEKYDSVLVRAVQKLENIHINNLKLISMDAINIDEIFNKEIDMLYLNFSDPWPKNRHENRRLTSPVFLQKYDGIFKHNNRIRQKTDNKDFFAYSIQSFNNYGYKIDKITLDLENSIYKENNIKTEYETKFTSKGEFINFLEVYKDEKSFLP